VSNYNSTAERALELAPLTSCCLRTDNKKLCDDLGERLVKVPSDQPSSNYHLASAHTLSLKNLRHNGISMQE
jgi:hypothetical protein